jgi:hypothetical protein
MTGASQTKPKAVNKLYEEYEVLVKQNPDLTIMLGYEYFGPEKIRTIASDATAFYFRQAPPNIMLQCVFDGKATNIKELELKSKEIIRKLKKIYLEDGDDFSYANYSDG